LVGGLGLFQQQLNFLNKVNQMVVRHPLPQIKRQQPVDIRVS